MECKFALNKDAPYLVLTYTPCYPNNYPKKQKNKFGLFEA